MGTKWVWTVKKHLNIWSSQKSRFGSDEKLTVGHRNMKTASDLDTIYAKLNKNAKKSRKIAIFGNTSIETDIFQSIICVVKKTEI